jgi:hypothetical protein
MQCPLRTQSGHERSCPLNPISPVTNPCCNHTFVSQSAQSKPLGWQCGDAISFEEWPFVRHGPSLPVDSKHPNQCDALGIWRFVLHLLLMMHSLSV